MTGCILAVNKKAGWTSHDAVQRLRRVLDVREIGHAGSLDPFATGVLICGIGRGTKILPFMLDLPKDYTGAMRLGRVTDSGDGTGEIIEERPLGSLDLEGVRLVARSFTGHQKQIPPMLSALKQNGKRLYELARKGIEVERTPRTVLIHSFEILDLTGDLLEFRVVCGRGTYIRTLAADYGDALGPGACVERLHRRAVGAFDDSLAVSIDGDNEAVLRDCQRAFISMTSALDHLPALTLRSEWVRRVRQGTQPPWRAIQSETIPEATRFRLLGPESALVAVASLEPVPGLADRAWKDSWELHLERVL
jgi:tRNA pseudouridine55 synthase